MNSIEEKKAKLIQRSANEVRNNKTLFADFVEVYIAEGGSKKDCYTCRFKSVFERWKQSSPKIQKKQIMSKSNTFKLKGKNTLIYIPGGGGVVTEKSPDTLVEDLFKALPENRKEVIKERFFIELPESMRQVKKAPKKVDKKEPAVEKEEKKEVSKIEKYRAEYMEKFGKKVPNKFKNDLDWISNRIGKY